MYSCNQVYVEIKKNVIKRERNKVKKQIRKSTIQNQRKNKYTLVSQPTTRAIPSLYLTINSKYHVCVKVYQLKD